MTGSRLSVFYLTTITYISRAVVGFTSSTTLQSIIWQPLFGQHQGNMVDDNWETVPTKKRRDRGGDNGHGRYQPPISVEFIPPTAATMEFQPFVLLLCGIPGSGKSTFAKALETAMPYKFVRINQDELGNRKKCERKARAVLAANKCPVIDRCNFDENQRLNWFELARGMEKELNKQHNAGSNNNGTHYSIPVDCVVIQHSSLDECISRCQKRTGHETILPNQARSVVGIVASQFSVPGTDSSKKIQYRTVRTIPVEDNNIFHDVLLECLNTI